MKRLARIAVIGFLVACAGVAGILVGRLLSADVPVAKLNLAGEHSVAVAVRRPDGSVASGEPWSLRFQSDHNVGGIGVTYGSPPRTRQIQPVGVSMDLTLASGVVPESGVIELHGLPGGEHAQFLHLFVGDDGYLAFSLPDEAKLHEDLTMELPVHLRAGSTAPSMEVIRIEDKSVTTVPAKGKVTYLEFWGVHCGPCQKPLSELDALAKRRPEWKGKIQLASICLDPLEDVRRHVAARGLTNADHFIPATMAHPSSGQPNAYGVRGVPKAFLVDATGQIVWSGHPAGFDVERQIEALLSR